MTTAIGLLDDLSDAGVVVSIAADDPDALDVDGPAQALTPERLVLPCARKPDLLTVLRGDTGPDDLPGDWRVEWEERAAIMEYVGELPRERAEAEALADVLRQMHANGDEIPGKTI